VNEHEDDLGRALGRSLETIPVADPDAALARVTARSRVVRRRRLAVRAGAAIAAAVVVGAVWLGARPPGSTQVDTVDTPSIATAPRPGTDGTSPSTPVTTGGPASTVVTSVTASVATTAPPPSTPSAPPSSAGAAPSAAPSAAPPTAAQSSAPSPPPSSGPQTYGGVGGQVTVRVDAGNLVLVSVRPAAGYTVAEQKARPDDVEVRFEGPAGRTRVRIRLDGGVVSHEVREEGPS
jgi:hypothetical protein